MRDGDPFFDTGGHLCLASGDGVEDFVTAIETVMVDQDINELFKYLGLVFGLKMAFYSAGNKELLEKETHPTDPRSSMSKELGSLSSRSLRVSSWCPLHS